MLYAYELMDKVIGVVMNMKPLEIAFVCIALSVALYGLLGISRVRRAYAALLRDLDNVRTNGPDQASHPTLQTLLSEYGQAVRRARGPVDASTIVNRALLSLKSGRRPVTYWIRMVKATSSICLGIGLLGTFIGLILALYGVSGALQEASAHASSPADTAALLAQLQNLISGMTTAFQASVWGVFGSLLVNLLSARSGTYTRGNEIAHELDYYLANEYRCSRPASDTELMLERIGHLTETLEASLASGMGDAARQFGEAANSVALVLKSIEPITSSLGSSGMSLQALSASLGEVTGDLRNIMAALKIGQESLPQRMAELQAVEEGLVAALGSIPNQNALLLGGLDHFQSSTKQLEGTLSAFRQEWPTLMQEFVNHTEQAVERQTLGVAESIERLREIIEQGRRDTLEQMEQLVALNASQAEAVASALETRGSAARR